MRVHTNQLTLRVHTNQLPTHKLEGAHKPVDLKGAHKPVDLKGAHKPLANSYPPQQSIDDEGASEELPDLIAVCSSKALKHGQEDEQPPPHPKPRLTSLQMTLLSNPGLCTQPPVTTMGILL